MYGGDFLTERYDIRLLVERRILCPIQRVLRFLQRKGRPITSNSIKI